MAGIIKVNQYQDFNGNTLFTSDGNGNLTTQNIMKPAFFVVLSADQTISDDTETKVQFDTVKFDTDSAFDNTTNYRFTVPSGKAGKYQVFGAITLSSTSNSTLDVVHTKIYKNGSAENISHGVFRNNYLKQVTQLIDVTLDLADGDYLELYGYIDVTSGTPFFDAGTAGGALKSTSFGAYRIGS